MTTETSSGNGSGVHRKVVLVFLVIAGMLMLWFLRFEEDEIESNDRLVNQNTGTILTSKLVMDIDGHTTVFGEIGALVADSQNQIYVMDVQAQEVGMLDENGQRVGTIGGRGSGPGEFLRIEPTMAWIEDHLLLMDRRLQKLTLLGKENEVVWTRPFQYNRGDRFPTRYLFGTRDTAFLLEVIYGQMVAIDPTQQIDPSRIPAPQVRYAIIDSIGSVTVIDSVTDSVSELGIRQGPMDCIGPNKWIYFVESPFGDRGPRRAFTSGGELLKADADNYRIDVIDIRTGVTVRTLERDVPLVPLDDETWDQLPEIRELRRIEQAAGGRLEKPGHPGTPCPIYDERKSHMPMIRSIVTDDLGRVWVEVTTSDGFAFNLFDNSGEFIGEIATPDRDPDVTPYVRGNRLYVVTIDELDVQGIEVYEVEIGG